MNDANLYTGRPKVGKTTLVENLAVAVAGGRELLGKPTHQGSVFFLAGEDRYGELRDNLRVIGASLQVSDDALQRYITLFSVRSDRVEGGHKLIDIDDSGIIRHGRFLREVVMPHLDSLLKPCLWIIDPLAVFVGFNRYSDTAARALVDGFFNDIVDMGVTPLLTDHPSQASVDDGRNVAGSVQLAAAFPLVGTLKAGDWQANIQRPMTYEIIGSRYSASDEGNIDFFRLKDTPAFSQYGAPGHSKREVQEKVYNAVLDLVDNGASVSRDKRAHADHTPATLAQYLIMNEADISAALTTCMREGWLRELARDQKAGLPTRLTFGGRGPKRSLHDHKPV